MGETRTLEQTIKIIEKLSGYHRRIYEREGGAHWLKPWEANEEILAILLEPEPDATKIRQIIESMPENFGGTAWYEVRMMIWLWEDSDRGEKP